MRGLLPQNVSRVGLVVRCIIIIKKPFYCVLGVFCILVEIADLSPCTNCQNPNEGCSQIRTLFLIASTSIHMSFAINGPSERAMPTVPDVEATGMVLDDQYKFSQTEVSPFIIDQFSAFDYSGYSVYKVYVHTINQTDFVHRIFGNADYPAVISAQAVFTTTHSASERLQAGTTGFFYGGYNAHEIDSWVGIDYCVPERRSW